MSLYGYLDYASLVSATKSLWLDYLDADSQSKVLNVCPPIYCPLYSFLASFNLASFLLPFNQYDINQFVEISG